MCVDVCWVVVTVEQLLIVLIRLWTKSELVRSDVRYSSVDPFSRPPSVVSSLYRPIKMALVDSSETYDAEQLARSMRETHLPDWMRISLPAIPSSLLVCGPSSIPSLHDVQHRLRILFPAAGSAPHTPYPSQVERTYVAVPNLAFVLWESSPLYSVTTRLQCSCSSFLVSSSSGLAAYLTIVWTWEPVISRGRETARQTNRETDLHVSVLPPTTHSH
jgi:hypothetical protein